MWALQEFSARNCELVSPLRGISCASGKLSRLRRWHFALDFPRASSVRFWSQLPRIESLTKTMKKGEKVHLGPQLFRGEGGEATLKRRVSFWSVTMTFPSKVQPAGGCFELQTLYWACRVFVLKSSKSQDILVKIWCFTQKCRFEQHPPLRTYTNSSLASCILVQLTDLCNLGFAVHVQYGITNTCWRHARLYWGVCRGASHHPNSLIYKKKSPKLLFASKGSLKKLGILCIFGQRNGSKFREGPLLSDLHPLR